MTQRLRERLQVGLGSSYTIERELDGGGMSHVFLAEETRLRRKVVIKVLPPDISGAVSVERFEREIQLAARLQHPHIVPLLAAGEADGLLYYTMPFIEGEALRDRMSREGRVAYEAALRIAAEVADALDYAHTAGVVHRDIKPENILLSAGHAVVADFGIAKALSMAAAASQNATLTQLGTSLGTPAYMSPEQAAGDPDLDGRSDIYSLGCVLYEMLAGRQPFVGPTIASVIAKRFSETPARLSTMVAALPVGVDAVVERAMEREPAQRFATAGDAQRAMLAPQGSSGPRRAVASADEKPSVAVLPFSNLGGNADDEYFSDGMTEEVINVLARLPAIRVAARTSAFEFKGKSADLRVIAEQLRVRTVLEGSVRRAGNRVRISVQLVSASDGEHLWTERFDREIADVFALQDEIAHAIAVALSDRLGASAGATVPADSGSSRIPERSAVDPAAYDLFLRGRFLFEQHAALDAIRCFERVVVLDPSFALAHAWLALANMLAANLGLMPHLIGYPRGREGADRALALNPELPEALLARGVAATWFEWDQALAEKLFRETLALAPGWPHSHEFMGWVLTSRGQKDEGIRFMEHAYALDPLSDFMLYNLAHCLICADRGGRAIHLLRPAVARSPGNAGLQLLLGAALYSEGHVSEAGGPLERAREIGSQNVQYHGTLVSVLAALGDTSLARQRLSELEALATGGSGSPIEVACGYHALGDDETALVWIERAFEARSHWMTWLSLDPRFRKLRANPAFQSIVERVRRAEPPRSGRSDGVR